MIIGMVKMKDAHTAENVLVAIQEILAVFKFNKAKISAIVCDEGSDLLRLFSPIDSSNAYYLNYVEEEKDDANDHDYEPMETSDDEEDDSDEEDDNASDDDDDNTANAGSTAVECKMRLKCTLRFLHFRPFFSNDFF